MRILFVYTMTTYRIAGLISVNSTYPDADNAAKISQIYILMPLYHSYLR